MSKDSAAKRLKKAANAPIISIVVPLFQAGDFVDACIHTIKSQEYGRMEILLVDDGSTDRTKVACRAAERADARFFYLYQEHAGSGSARNYGLSRAKGKYILFLDADDTFASDHAVRDMIESMERAEEAGNPCDILVGNYLRRRHNGVIETVMHGFDEQEDTTTPRFRFEGFFSKGHLAYVWGKLYRRAFLTAHDITFTDLPYAEDKLFNFCCYANRPHYLFVKDEFYIFQRHAEATANLYRKDMDEVWLTLAGRFEKYIRRLGTHPEDLDLCAYTMAFGIFFHARQELVAGFGRRGMIDVLKRYRGNDRAMRYVTWLAEGRYIRRLDHKVYRTGVPAFCRLLMGRHYGVLAEGIKWVVDHDWDHRLYASESK